jgi:type IV pilus assembly protein PilA
MHLKKDTGGNEMKGNRGFSLLELLIVVAIILIIATIAIPSLLRSRQAANESAAVANLRTINTAQVTYLSSSGGLYGGLTDLQTAGLIDTSFSSATGKSGYTYTVATAVGEYTVTATPTATNSGRYGYYSTPDGVVRWQTATSTNCAPCFPTGMGGAPVQ